MRQSIYVETQLAITLWCLATPTDYCTIGHLFGVGHSTCNEIVKQLSKMYIKFPQGHELNHVVLTFKRKFGVPQCFVAIDGCHIPICAPVGNITLTFTTQKVGIL